MSIGAISTALLLLVSIHACNARRTPGFGIHKNNVGDGKTNQVDYEMGIKSVHAFENTKQRLSGDAGMSITTLDDTQKNTIQIEGFGRNVRSMVEFDQTPENKEPSDVNGDEPVEDAEVMDYVTPHRKSPIHNHYDVECP